MKTFIHWYCVSCRFSLNLFTNQSLAMKFSSFSSSISLPPPWFGSLGFVIILFVCFKSLLHLKCYRSGVKFFEIILLLLTTIDFALIIAIALFLIFSLLCLIVSRRLKCSDHIVGRFYFLLLKSLNYFYLKLLIKHLF